MKHILLASAGFLVPLYGADNALSFTFGAHYDYTCVATASVAIQPRDRDDLGWFVQLSPGIRGGKASVGFGVNGFVGPCTGALDAPIDDIALVGKLSYLTTWNPPGYLGVRQQYIGIEAEAGLALTGSVGVFRAITPSKRGDDWIFSWSIGIGL
jgi:hypothetical protein